MSILGSGCSGELGWFSVVAGKNATREVGGIIGVKFAGVDEQVGIGHESEVICDEQTV
jgi:hypothetical protein